MNSLSDFQTKRTVPGHQCYYMKTKKNRHSYKKVFLKSNAVRDEFTFSAEDNAETLESPIKLFVCK